MKGRRILFQDPDPRVLRAAERALVATGAEVEVVLAGHAAASSDRVRVAHAGGGAAGGGGRFTFAAHSDWHRERAAPPSPGVVADPAFVLERLERGAHDLVMLNYDPPVRADPGWAAVFDRLAERPPPCGVVLHATAASEDYLPLLAERRFVRNLIAKNDEPLDPEELITTASKLLRGDLFGLEKYLLWGVAPLRLPVRDSREKNALIGELRAYADRLCLSPRTFSLVEAIADELITNAIYNAPRDGAGRPKYAAVPRRTPVALEASEHAELTFACDGNFLGIAMSDPFGALTHGTIVEYLNRCLIRPEPLEPSFGSSGAGIGLYRIFHSLTKFVVNLDPGKRTEVIALIDLRLGMRRFRQAAKSFHIFVCEREVPRGS
jgi:hypothetical protein